MCLVTNKKLKLSLFPKTVYKVVTLKFLLSLSDDEKWTDIYDNTKVISLYQGFTYEIGKLYTKTKEDIAHDTEYDRCSGYCYGVGFHSYKRKQDAKGFMKTFKCHCKKDNLAIVKCRIPAFSWIAEGKDGEIVSNKIKIVKIMK